jgi:DNA-binding response OmpR family regulator
MELKKFEHKILAIGNPMMVRRLASKIDSEQFVVTGCHNPAEAANFLEREKFDMVIVDDLVHDAELVCQSAACTGDTPVTLLLQEKPVDWKGRGALAVDGFLPDGGTNAEFMARLRAYMRRQPTASNCLYKVKF